MMPRQNPPDPATLCQLPNWFLWAVFDRRHGILIGQPAPTAEGYLRDQYIDTGPAMKYNSIVI